jgi:hypothetical protein
MEFVRQDRGPLKGQPVGVVIATKVNGNIVFGWSKNNVKEGDRFNKARAIDIAHERLKKGTRRQVPHLVRKKMNSMIARASKEFNVPIEKIGFLVTDRGIDRNTANNYNFLVRSTDITGKQEDIYLASARI